MSFRQSLKISSDRIGAVVGREGKTKKWVEDSCGVVLTVDSRTGDVTIESSSPVESEPLKAVEIVNAIARGFSQERAARLLKGENIMSIIDLRSYLGKSQSSLNRIKGRIIGDRGRARMLIEELTKTDISVSGHTVAIIGNVGEVKLAEEAVDILASGRPHRSAYQLLQRRRTEAKLERLKLWEDRSIGE